MSNSTPRFEGVDTTPIANTFQFFGESGVNTQDLRILKFAATILEGIRQNLPLLADTLVQSRVVAENAHYVSKIMLAATSSILDGQNIGPAEIEHYSQDENPKTVDSLTRSAIIFNNFRCIQHELDLLLHDKIPKELLTIHGNWKDAMLQDLKHDIEELNSCIEEFVVFWSNVHCTLENNTGPRVDELKGSEALRFRFMALFSTWKDLERWFAIYAEKIEILGASIHDDFGTDYSTTPTL